MGRIAELVREGVRVIPAVRIALWPPPRLRGRVRLGTAQAVNPRWWTTEVPGWVGTAKPPPGTGLVGCARCKTHNAVNIDLFVHGAMVDCLGEGCDALLTTDGTWIPEGASTAGPGAR